MLASDSDESVIFVAEKPLPSIQVPYIIVRGATQALPTFQVQSVTPFHPLVGIY